MGKSWKLPFSDRVPISKFLLESLHLDLWGPSYAISKDGYRFYLSTVDDHTKYVWLYPLVKKYDTFSRFINFKR